MKDLIRAMDILKIPYDESTLEKFYLFREKILIRNKEVNLTAINDPVQFEIKHFVDSLLCCIHPEFSKCKCIADIGTGAGFPGMPLAICFKDKRFVLIDSLFKRVKIVEDIAGELEISNVNLIHGRAEDLAREKVHRDGYDMVLSRAVADLKVLAEYCLPFVKVKGLFGAYKSLKSQNEMEESERAVKLLGGRLESRTFVPVKGIDLPHMIVWIRKVKPTPAKYPRKAGMPGKKPLI